MKLIVETTGPFMILDLNPYQAVQPDRPSVVAKSNIIDNALKAKRVKIVAENVPADLTDEAFAIAYAKDKDATLAKFKPTPAPTVKPKA